jgi:hypothetical protein
MPHRLCRCYKEEVSEGTLAVMRRQEVTRHNIYMQLNISSLMSESE